MNVDDLAKIAEQDSILSVLEDCWDLMISDPDSAMILAKSAMNRSELESELYFKAYCYLGMCHFYSGRFNEAIDILNVVAVHTAQLGQDENTRVTNNALGMCFHSLGRYDIALEHYGYAADYARKIGDDSILLPPLINSGTLLFDVGDVDSAVEILTEVMGLSFEGTSEENISVVYLLESRTLIHEGRYDEAEQIAARAESLARNVNYQTGIYTSRLLQARIFRLQKNYSQAIKILESLTEDTDIVTVGADALEYFLELGKVYFLLNKIDKAINTLQKGIHLLNPPRHNLMRLRALDQIAIGYRQQNDIKNELLTLREIVNIERSEQYAQDQDLVARSKIKRQHDKRLLEQELIKRQNKLLKANHQRLSLVNEIAHQVGQTLNFEELGHRLFKILTTHLDVHFISLMTMNDEAQSLTFRFIVDSGLMVKEADIPIDRDNSYSTAVVKSRQHILIRDAEVEGLGTHIGDAEIMPRTMLFMPLILEESVIGVFSIQSPIPERYGKNEIQLMLAISKFIAVSVSNILSHEKVQQLNQSLSSEKQAIEQAQRRIAHMAFHDSLTSLPNRQALDVFVDRRIKVQKRPFHLVYIDLDKFKPVNDKYGHRVGDEVLMMISQRIKDSLRHRDFAARIGGDEFILIVDEFSQQADLDHFLQRLLKIIEQPIVSDVTELLVSASIGVARYPTQGQDLDSLMHNADSAMYQVKREGKGGVKSY
jgi:diguanylate cyclase (GGDEF)-like protein